MLDHPLPAPLMVATATGDRSLCLLHQSNGDVIAIAYAIDSDGHGGVDQIALTLRPDQVRQIAGHLAPIDAPATPSTATPVAPMRPANGAAITRPSRPAPTQRPSDRRVFALHEYVVANIPTAMIHTATCADGLPSHTASASWLANYIGRTPGAVLFCERCSPLGADTTTVNSHISESVPASNATKIALDLTLAVLHRQAATLSERVEKR